MNMMDTLLFIHQPGVSLQTPLVRAQLSDLATRLRNLDSGAKLKGAMQACGNIGMTEEYNDTWEEIHASWRKLLPPCKKGIAVMFQFMADSLCGRPHAILLFGVFQKVLAETGQVWNRLLTRAAGSKQTRK